MKEANDCMYCGADLDEYVEGFCDDCFADMVDFDL